MADPNDELTVRKIEDTSTASTRSSTAYCEDTPMDGALVHWSVIGAAG